MAIQSDYHVKKCHRWMGLSSDINREMYEKIDSNLFFRCHLNFIFALMPQYNIHILHFFRTRLTLCKPNTSFHNLNKKIRVYCTL